MTQEETNRANWEHCKSIAESVEAYAEGRVYKCPDCGEEFEMSDTAGKKYCCPNCRAVYEIGEYEQMSLYDYLTDVLDIRYLLDSNRNVIAVKLLVTFGGPNIWIDTESGAVELYWWGDRATYELMPNAIDELNSFAEELFHC